MFSSTHYLTQLAKGVLGFVKWIEEILFIIEHVLAQDILFLSSSK